MKKYFFYYIFAISIITGFSSCSTIFSSKDYKNIILSKVNHPIEIQVNQKIIGIEICDGTAYFTNPIVTIDRSLKKIFINYDLTISGDKLCPGECKACKFSTSLLEVSSKVQFKDLEIEDVNCNWAVPKPAEMALLRNVIKGHLYKIVIALNEQIKDCKSIEFTEDNRIKVLK
jgi:hypothetical protein